MVRRIAQELKRHVPFTALGALTGIVIMAIVVLGNVPSHVSHTVFYTLHPVHVLLSALVTTAMYTRYRKAKVWVAILIGWTGSIGIATISDAIIPYLGGTLLHAQMEFHVPFI
jgi:Trk-type K+ transport system membrane component